MSEDVHDVADVGLEANERVNQVEAFTKPGERGGEHLVGSLA
jgi:hypothetical protein